MNEGFIFFIKDTRNFIHATANRQHFELQKIISA